MFSSSFTMDSRLYEQKLAGHKIFKDLEECFTDNPTGKLRNLLELKDDVLYVWNPKETCLWCLNLKQLEELGDETPYQKLHFLSPPSFSVERVLASPCGTRISVWGARGVTVAELPTRWSRGCLFVSCNDSVLCKSACLDERLLYAQGEVRRVHWHPNSLSHLIVLVSDNSIRLYNIAQKSGPKIVKVFPIGSKPCSLISGRTLLESLGDTAVDFTPIPDTDTLLILRGNGDVYMLTCELDGKKGVQDAMVGPLSMFPPADDNYGSESCCVAALGAPGAPPLIVLASASAALYHCLLLPRTGDTEEGDSHALYVVESVELNTTDDVLHSYAVLIYPCSNTSYAVIHSGGVHTVTLPILAQLTEYAEADEVDTESMLSSLCRLRSGARHVARLAPAPALGLALSPPPLPQLLILCTDARLITRVLEPFDLEEQLYKEMQLQNPALLQDDINDILKEKQRISFTSILQEILSREASQPILHISRRDASPQESLELLSESCMRLRREYMSRQARAAAALSHKLHAHTALQHSHRACLTHLQADAEEVLQQSAVLRDKCILAEKRQDDFKYRFSAVIRCRSAGETTEAERRLLRQLVDSRARADALADRLRHTRQHAARRQEELKQWKEDYKRNDIAFGHPHIKTILAVLQQQTVQISSLIEETKLLKDELSIV